VYRVVVLALLLGAAAEFFNVLARVAVKLARRAAYLHYGDTPRAEVRAEEWSAVIEDRPGQVLKLGTALWFIASSACYASARGLGQVRTSRSRRLDTRGRSILTVAAVAAVMVNTGVVWAYWKMTASETGRLTAGSEIEMTLRGRSDLNQPLTPGSTGNLAVTVANDHDLPIRVTSITPGPGAVVADDEHRDAGCMHADVSLVRTSFPVSWDITRNTVALFTVPGALRMANNPANKACEGATFTVPLQVNGVAGLEPSRRF
jgi:hypothetical protein